MGKPRIAIAGATGLVGRTMLQVLHEQGVEYASMKLLASARSVGTEIKHGEQTFTVEELKEDSFGDVDIALFSCGGDASRKYAPHAEKAGAIVIDNSSAWRMDPSKALIVPEVNSDKIPQGPSIIANPNCSTIQLVVALKPIQELFGLKRVICSTYQSISGAGQSGVDRLQEELADPEKNKGKRIAFSTLFHSYQSDGRTDEENKMRNETKKIMSLPNLDISVTCVRLPILGGHAEAVWVETERAVDLEKLKSAYADAEGVVFTDKFEHGEFPTPESVDGKDPVYIARLSEDDVFENGIRMWVVADNLRKGAATNAVQIAKKVIEQQFS